MTEIKNTQLFEEHVDLALDIANSSKNQLAKVYEFPDRHVDPPAQENPFPSDAQYEKVQDIEAAQKENAFKKTIGKVAVGLGAGALLAGSFMGGLSGDKSDEQPDGPPEGFSDTLVEYEVGGEPGINTPSDLAVEVARNVPGEQGTDPTMKYLNDVKERYIPGAGENTYLVPDNADINPDKPGVQLVDESRE